MWGGNRTLWIAVGVTFVIGIVVGRFIYSVASQPNLAALLAFFLMLLFVGVVAILLLVGLLIAAFGDRHAGLTIALLALVAGTGAYVAAMYGEGIQIVSQRSARLDVMLNSPINDTFSGGGTCYTVANSEVIARVQGDTFIVIGNDRMSISIVLDDEGPLPQHRVTLVADDPDERLASYYSGIVSDIEVDADGDRVQGTVTFANLDADPQRDPLGGIGGPTELDGSATWTCNEADQS